MKTIIECKTTKALKKLTLHERDSANLIYQRSRLGGQIIKNRFGAHGPVTEKELESAIAIAVAKELKRCAEECPCKVRTRDQMARELNGWPYNKGQL